MWSALEVAGTWLELGDLCAEADRLYGAGALEQGQVEELALSAIARADGLLPARAGDSDIALDEQTVLVPLSAAGAAPCASCGSPLHWHNHGQRVCAVCHPHPGPPLAAERPAA